jgi:hypothetical protein
MGIFEQSMVVLADAPGSSCPPELGKAALFGTLSDQLPTVPGPSLVIVACSSLPCAGPSWIASDPSAGTDGLGGMGVGDGWPGAGDGVGAGGIGAGVGFPWMGGCDPPDPLAPCDPLDPSELDDALPLEEELPGLVCFVVALWEEASTLLGRVECPYAVAVEAPKCLPSWKASSRRRSIKRAAPANCSDRRRRVRVCIIYPFPREWCSHAPHWIHPGHIDRRHISHREKGHRRKRCPSSTEPRIYEAGYYSVRRATMGSSRAAR